MKRITAFILIGLAAGILVAGCGSGGSVTSPEDGVPDSLAFTWPDSIPMAWDIRPWIIWWPWDSSGVKP